MEQDSETGCLNELNDKTRSAEILSRPLTLRYFFMFTYECNFSLSFITLGMIVIR